MSDVIADWPRDRMLGLLTLGRRHGLSESVLLAGAGIGLTQLAASDHGASMADEHTVIRNLLAHTDPSLPLALEAGLDFHLIMVGSWGQAIRTSPDLGSAIAFALRSATTMPTSVQVSAVVDGDQLMIRFDDSQLPDDVRVFVTIRNMVFLAMTARELLGHALPLNSVTGAAPRVPYGDVLDEFCGTPVTWDAGANSVTTDVCWLAQPLPGADPDRHAQAVGASYRMLERHRDRDGAAARVRRMLDRLPENLPRTELTLERVAADLNTSARSLRRRLDGEGTTFRDLVDQDRLARAQDLLASGHSIDEVSRRLGYSETAAFSRAFKRWTGSPPDAWRRITTAR